MSTPIRDPSLARRLSRAFDLSGGRFVITDMDETVKPVVVVDTLARNDARFGTPDRVYGFGAVCIPAATDHALFRMRILSRERVVRVKEVQVSSSSANVECQIAMSTAPAMVGGGTLAVGGAWSRTNLEQAAAEIAFGSVVPGNLPSADLDNVSGMRLNSAAVIWTRELDVTFNSDSNPGALVVFLKTVNVVMGVCVQWEEFDR